MHETGIHGGPSARMIGIAAALAFVFGSCVLIAGIAGGTDGVPVPEHGAQPAHTSPADDR